MMIIDVIAPLKKYPTPESSVTQIPQLNALSPMNRGNGIFPTP